MLRAFRLMRRKGADPARMPQGTFQRLSTATAIAAYLLVILGGAVKAFGAGPACTGWPLCGGTLLPPLDGLVLLNWAHRTLGLAVGLLAVAAAVTAWRAERANRTVIIGSLLSLFLLAAQVVSGASYGPGAGALQTGVATAFFATVLTMAVSARQGVPLRRAGKRGLWLLPLAAAAMVWVTILLGGYLKSAGGGAACADWPLCHGQVVPAFDRLVWLDFLHRLAALATGILVAWSAWIAWRTQRTRPAIVATAVMAVGLYVLQVGLGAATALWALPPQLVVSHLALAAGLFGAMIVLTLLLKRAAQMPAIAGGAGVAALPAPGALPRINEVLRAYMMLMKPSIILLLLVTTYGAMWVANGGPPPLGVTFWTLLCGTFSSGGANAINMWYDRDIDSVMRRTRKRPIPAGLLTANQVLAFGVLSGALSFLVMGVAVNWLAASLSLSGLLFYVFIYTMWLKRSTPQNIVIGGAAGAVPPLVGWAAITGEVAWAPVIMFLIVFLWTPPHFWALALFRAEDYRNARVPMMPVVKGVRRTKWESLIYAVLTVLSTLALYPLGVVGKWYLLVAALAGGYFVWTCVALLRDQSGEQRTAHVVFGYSILYLFLVFLAMVLDTVPR